MMPILADKSAWEQRHHSEVARRALLALAGSGALAMCEMVALELLHSARSRSDYEERWSGMRTLSWLHVTEAVMSRALGIQRALAERGQHRRPLPDLIIAATAAEHDAVVLHYDHDFDLIAEVTGQPTLWIIPRGTGHGRSA